MADYDDDHKCSSECIALETQKLEEHADQYVILSDGVLSKRESPFAVMFDFGWERSDYGYRLPCGKKTYSLKKIQRFLFCTGSRLSIDQFHMDMDLNCFMTKRNSSSSGRLVTADVAQGTENVPIPCVNDVDSEDIDPRFTYSPHRSAIAGIDLNTGLVSGCGCTDRCVNKLTCDCRLLTEETEDLSGVRWLQDSRQFGGYSEKSLTKLYIPGMYECNKSCSCGPRCQNRVSQEGIKAHLQVFRTAAKGWGLRCLHDLPGGYFVCLYSGEVLDNRTADDVAPVRGDEFFVSMNLIEIVEDKLGYESGADLSSGDSASEHGSDCSLLPSEFSEASSESLIPGSCSGVKRQTSRQKEEEENLSSKKRKKNSPCSSSGGDGSSTSDPKEGFVKVRKHLEKERRHLTKSQNVLEGRVSDSADVDSDDDGYVIDAKWKGNAGRFLNHSCSPNCLLQNIFTDTHDPRFPVMGFFTARKVNALEELTWDYLYEDEVHVFDCLCSSSSCKRNNKTSPNPVACDAAT